MANSNVSLIDAKEVVKFLDREGLLDYDNLKEYYDENA